MKRLLACAVLCLPAAASAAVAPESLGGAAAAAFASSPQDIRAAFAAAALQGAGPALQPALQPRPFSPSAAAGPVLARVSLSGQLNRNFRLLNERLGARVLDLGAATDAGFKKFYLTFTDGAGTALGALGNLNALRGSGVSIRLDPATAYNFRVSINIFNPVRGSTLWMEPTAGTSGPTQSVKTGAVLDAARARATRVVLDGSEYWIFYGSDVRADGRGFAATRSFLFVHEDGLSSKAWPLAAASLTPGRASVVDLGGVRAAVTLTADALLVGAP
jgi:hypothetical protein